MPIQALNLNNRNNYNSPKKSVNFKATPAQIAEKIATSDNICNGKRAFFTRLVTFFDGIQKQMKETPNTPQKFEFNLEKRNTIPKSLKNLKSSNESLKTWNEELNSTRFACSPDGHCTCGEGLTKGQFVSKFFEALGIEKPQVIKLSKTNAE